MVLKFIEFDSYALEPQNPTELSIPVSPEIIETVPSSP